MTITIKATNTRKAWGTRNPSRTTTEDEELAMLMAKVSRLLLDKQTEATND
jgi:hypothetical protein|tara:strand:+ start:522 stop:674 length:153 start_codon:yes stop_codon:yes gene_type:complete